MSEVTHKSDSTIERETARKWMKRAVDCDKEYVKTNDVEWLLRAENYWHEALEHAAFVNDGGRLVVVVKKRMTGRRAKRKR